MIDNDTLKTHETMDFDDEVYDNTYIDFLKDNLHKKSFLKRKRKPNVVLNIHSRGIMTKFEKYVDEVETMISEFTSKNSSGEELHEIEKSIEDSDAGCGKNYG